VLLYHHGNGNGTNDETNGKHGTPETIRDMMETQIGSLAAELKANQAKTDADRKADREERKAERKAHREEILEKNGRQYESHSRGNESPDWYPPLPDRCPA
jgi:hypothetical protein